MTGNSTATIMTPGNLQSDQCSPSTGWQVTAPGGAVLRATWAVTQQTGRAVALVQSNLTAAASITVALYTNPATLVATVTLAGPIAGYGQVVALFAQDYPCDYAQVSINDASNPDNHINVGGMFAGALWIPTQGMTWDTMFDRNHRLLESQSRGGQKWPVYLSQQRIRSFTLGNLRGSEIALQQDLLRVAGYGSNVLRIPNTGSSTLARDAVYGRLRSSTGAYPFHNADRLSWTATVTERL